MGCLTMLYTTISVFFIVASIKGIHAEEYGKLLKCGRIFCISNCIFIRFLYVLRFALGDDVNITLNWQLFARLCNSTSKCPFSIVILQIKFPICFAKNVRVTWRFKKRCTNANSIFTIAANFYCNFANG